MNIKLLKKHVMVGAVVATTGLAGAVVAAPSPFTATATVQLVAAIDITEDLAMDFGLLSDDASGGTATLDLANAISGVTGGTTAVGGTPQTGDYDIVGDGTATINIDVNNVVADTGVTLSNFTASYGGAGYVLATAAAAAPGAGGTDLLIGADVTIPAALANGVYNPTFDIVVAYD